MPNQQNSDFFPDAAFDVVALATSAGGLAALSQIISALPANFPAAIVIVQHLDPHAHAMLPDILNRHLVINPDATFSLPQTERINFVRPSADLLFESLAHSCQRRGIAVVLTGTGKDGAAGIKAVKAMGGTTIVQDDKTAQFSGMPSAAIQTKAVDFILPIEQIVATLIKLVRIEGC